MNRLSLATKYIQSGIPLIKRYPTITITSLALGIIVTICKLLPLNKRQLNARKYNQSLRKLKIFLEDPNKTKLNFKNLLRIKKHRPIKSATAIDKLINDGIDAKKIANELKTSSLSDYKGSNTTNAVDRLKLLMNKTNVTSAQLIDGIQDVCKLRKEYREKSFSVDKQKIEKPTNDGNGVQEVSLKRDLFEAILYQIFLMCQSPIKIEKLQTEDDKKRLISILNGHIRNTTARAMVYGILTSIATFGALYLWRRAPSINPSYYLSSN